jgi:hypothetical protein
LILSDIDWYHYVVKNPKNPLRTTLLINLSVEQAEQIRIQAKKQDRTISAYVLRVVMSRLNVELKVEKRDQNFFEAYLDKARGLR